VVLDYVGKAVSKLNEVSRGGLSKAWREDVDDGVNKFKEVFYLQVSGELFLAASSKLLIMLEDGVLVRSWSWGYPEWWWLRYFYQWLVWFRGIVNLQNHMLIVDGQWQWCFCGFWRWCFLNNTGSSKGSIIWIFWCPLDCSGCSRDGSEGRWEEVKSWWISSLFTCASGVEATGRIWSWGWIWGWCSHWVSVWCLWG
jgi:hypothetical protein